jgi:predicted esterase
LILARVAIVCSAGMVQAQSRELRPLSSETLDAVLTFLDVDASVPLDAHVVETATDYRRALQYVETRPELDLGRIGTVGQSMGGITSVYLAAVEPRVSIVVAGAAALAEPWLYPLSPINLAPVLRRTQVLLIAASKDSLIPRANVDALTAALPTENRQLRLLESDHRLPKDYVELAVDWIAQGLRR